MKVTTYSNNLRIGLLSGLLVVTMLLTGCGSGGVGDEAVLDTFVYRIVACPQSQKLPPGVTMECGALSVPESRSDTPLGRKIELAVFRLSRKDRVSGIPMLYLAGGPGSAASDAIGGWAESSVLAVRDVVLFDQRGTGLSSPTLTCQELDDTLFAHYTNPKSLPEELKAARDGVEACVKRATAAGIDLRAYNSIETAYDARDLRRALKIDRWHVMGISYGARAALAVMRYANDGIASFILDSVPAPDQSLSARARSEDANRALERLFASCAADAQCTANNGDLRARFAEMVQRYDASPWTLNVQSQPGKPPIAFTLKGSDFAALILSSLGQSELIPKLPGLISALAEGRNADTESFVRSNAEQLASTSDSKSLTNLAVNCNDLRRLATAADDEFERNPGRWAAIVRSNFSSYCRLLPGNGNPVDYNQPVTSSTPTLLIAGEFDPITLPERTRQAGVTLSRRTGVLIRGGGHIAGVITSCGRDVIDAYLAAPEKPVLPACASPLGS